jgi:cytoskeletal protein RodZ
MTTKKCKHCQSEIDKKAKVCPVCKKKQGGILKFVIIGIIAIFIIGALVNGGDDEPKLIETPNGENDKQNEETPNGENDEQNEETPNNEEIDDTNDSSEPTATATPIPEKTSFSPGETAELKDIRVTLVGVTESEGSKYNNPADGNIFAFAEFEIENNSNEEITVSSIMSFEAYSDGYSISQSIAAILERDDKSQLDGKIASGKKMNGAIGYEMSEDWSELEIQGFI